MHLFIIWYVLSHLVRTSLNSCLGRIWTGLLFSTNNPLLFPVSIQVIKASRRCPEDRIVMTILRRRAMGSCAQAASNDCPNPRRSSVSFTSAIRSSESSSFSGASTEDIFLSTCWTAMLIMCGKHIILLSFASKENISRSSNNFSKNSSILSFVVRLSRVQWPDCLRMSDK